MLKEIKPVKLLENVYALGLGILLKKEKVFILGDLHIGYEEYLNKQGILIPREQFKLTKNLLEKTLATIKPEKIIVNGDLKHEFGTISKQEWIETLKIFDILTQSCKEIILVKGNHDTILEPLANKRNFEVKDYVIVGNICITHGHKLLKETKELKNIKTIIIGNDHPAISIKDGIKSELYKCFLVGKWQRKNLIVMPSFLPIIEGTDIRKEKTLSPYLKQKLSDFKVFVVGDKIYEFGKLKDI
ncbi:MAG: metallophosphoesterase [Nanoarchaeota archaeon]|nr:metallophosphoesterase [Nanoarchaeota archaeon]